MKLLGQAGRQTDRQGVCACGRAPAGAARQTDRWRFGAQGRGKLR